MLPQNLGPAEVRVLGSLVEKELSTPDNYPLSLNSLVSACNQSSNRDPVTAFDSAAVSGAIDVLRRLDLVRSFQGSGERVSKYQHLLGETEDLSRGERAVLSVLCLRGPQTLAEVRTRAAKLAGNDDGDLIESALHSLMARAPLALATRLQRRPGQKEGRYTHLLSGEITNDLPDLPGSAPMPPTDRVAVLEESILEMRNEISDLRAQLEAFRRQFE